MLTLVNLSVYLPMKDYGQQKTEFKLCLLYHPLFERLYFRPVYPTIWYFRPVYPKIWPPISQNMNFRGSTAIALLVYPTIWQAISQNMNFRKSAAIALRIWKYNTNLITMGQEVSKPVRHRKFDHPTIVNSNKSGRRFERVFVQNFAWSIAYVFAVFDKRMYLR